MKGYILLALLVVFGCASAYDNDDEVALLQRLLDLKRSQSLRFEDAPEERHVQESKEPTLRELLRNIESLLNKRTNVEEENVAEQKRGCGSCGSNEYCDGGHCVPHAVD